MKDIVGIYDKVAPEISKLYGQQTHIKGISEFAPYLPKKGKILDLGCGMGKDVAIFNELGFEAVGVDGSAGMIKEARKRYPRGKFYLFDIRNLNLLENNFDAVWSWSVMTHLNNKDKIRVLENINRILKSGGYFSQTIWRGRGLFISEDIYPRPHHLLGAHSWRKLYRKTGFTNPNIKYIKGKGRDSIRLTAQKYNNL